MQKWELTCQIVNITEKGFSGRINVSMVWTEKDKANGKTDWDKLTALANNGWELVSVTAITYGEGYTGTLLYTFKRPKE